jgi:hypothetical protein
MKALFNQQVSDKQPSHDPRRGAIANRELSKSTANTTELHSSE